MGLLSPPTALPAPLLPRDWNPSPQRGLTYIQTEKTYVSTEVEMFSLFVVFTV